MSPAVPLLSAGGAPPGGGPKSLKVVKIPDWLADVWILSRAWASCSLSTCEPADVDVVESRRDRRFIGEDSDVGERADLGVLLVAISSVWEDALRC